MNRTKIVATIGPASENIETLKYFKDNGVEICRLNVAHNSIQWHTSLAQKAKGLELKTMLDLIGPKNLIGEVGTGIVLLEGKDVILKQSDLNQGDSSTVVIPTEDDFSRYCKEGNNILIDDGEISLKVTKIIDENVVCKVLVGGLVKSNKGLTLVGKSIDKSIMAHYDKVFLKETLLKIKPDYIAVSFVRTAKDLDGVRRFLNSILDDHNEDEYSPKICTKFETAECVESSEIIESIVEKSDMIMVARGDLSLEVAPLYIRTTLLQDEIVRISKKLDKPVIVATGVLASMQNSSHPTRSEISDLYRTIYHNKAEYTMFSAETAVGSNPRLVVDTVNNLIDEINSPLF